MALVLHFSTRDFASIKYMHKWLKEFSALISFVLSPHSLIVWHGAFELLDAMWSKQNYRDYSFTTPQGIVCFVCLVFFSMVT